MHRIAVSARGARRAKTALSPLCTNMPAPAKVCQLSGGAIPVGRGRHSDRRGPRGQTGAVPLPCEQAHQVGGTSGTRCWASSPRTDSI